MVKNQDDYWMQQALELALRAQNEKEVPVGAVLVSKNQTVLGRGWNQVITTHDPCAHAEILALRAAAKHLQNHRLNNTTLYVTLEPCCMCAGALVHGRVGRLVFGTRDFKTGAAGSVYNLMSGTSLNHKVQIDEGCLEKECSNLLSTFFATLRI